MKRSEMLDILDKEFETRFEFIPSIRYNGVRRISEAVLTLIEEAGMIPPETSREACSDADFLFKYDRTNFDSGEDAGTPTYFVAGWDDE